MLKNILNLGTTLNKTEQQSINGGGNRRRCSRKTDCYTQYLGAGDVYCGSNGWCQFW
jgi:hypothetical protein